MFDHLTYSVLQPVRNSVYHWLDPGQYGVFVFFLVSGYIVPASTSCPLRWCARAASAVSGWAGCSGSTRSTCSRSAP
ncbi:MAG: hypothetical protein ACRDOH_30835 [Streptosporangiaceae bacterium]